MRTRLILSLILFVIPLGVSSAQDAYPTLIDLDRDSSRQVIVDREKGQYLGHPTTCLLEDGKTILCVYPKGHGKGAVVYKRSSDGGKTWSQRLETPKSWETSKETPTLHQVVDAKWKETNHHVVRIASGATCSL